MKIIGVDGLPGPGEGIEGVEQGWLAATCVYPTQGERIVRLALDILGGMPYEHDNFLQSMVVTPENVGMVALYSSQMQRQGWYQTKPAQPQDVQTAKQKYQQMRGTI